MQATIDNRDVSTTIRLVPQPREFSRGRQVRDGIVGHEPRLEETLERIDRVVDREAVALLSLSERKGIELRHCPAYAREWVTQERARIESGRSDLHARPRGDVENE